MRIITGKRKSDKIKSGTTRTINVGIDEETINKYQHVGRMSPVNLATRVTQAKIIRKKEGKDYLIKWKKEREINATRKKQAVDD